MILLFPFLTQTLVCPRILRNLSQPEQLARLKAKIECEQPTSDLYNFFGKIEIFPNEANTWDASSPPDHTSVQSVRISQHAYDFGGITTQNMRTSDVDITLQQFCIDNDITLRRASVLDGNVPTNHNRDSSSHRTGMNRSTRLQCRYSVPLDVTSFINGHASLNQESSGDGAAVQRTTQEGCDEIQNVECKVGAVGADPVLNKANISRDGPSLNEQALKSSSIFEDVNFVHTEVDNNVSSQTRGSNVKSVLLKTTTKRSILSKQGSVVETGLSVEQLDSVFQDTISSPLGTENLLLRGARLKNTEFIIGKFYSVFCCLCLVLHLICYLAFL